jgi:hypothetical protein
LVLGLFHGLYFAAFPPTYLAGAAMIQAVLIAVLFLVIPKSIKRAGALLLLCVSLAWFVKQLVVSS